ncbi:MAG: hypothetical protein WA979_08995 [Pacificimonas sp.]
MSTTVRSRIAVFFSMSAIISTIGLAGLASAQDLPAGVAPFASCESISGNEERLACFDAALADIRAAQTFARNDGFGLSQREIEAKVEQAPEGPVENNPAENNVGDSQASGQKEGDELRSVIREILSDGKGRKIFLLANGQLWRETSNSNYRGRVKAGAEVSVKKGFLSGYRLKLVGGNGFFGVSRIR